MKQAQRHRGTKAQRHKGTEAQRHKGTKQTTAGTYLRNTLKTLCLCAFVPLCLLFVPLCLSPVNASLFEYEETLSNRLQIRIQESLDKVFGRNRSAVMVSVNLAMEPEIVKGIKNSLAGGQDAGKTSYDRTEVITRSAPNNMLWDRNDDESSAYLLPGFEAGQEQVASSKVSEERQDRTLTGNATRSDSSLVLAAGLFLKQVSVKVVLDKYLPRSSEQTASSIISDFVRLDKNRGDSLVMERIRMPSSWQEMLANPAAFTQIVQRIIIILGTIVIVWFLVVFLSSTAQTLRQSAEAIASAISTGKDSHVKKDSNVKIENSHKDQGQLPLTPEQPDIYTALEPKSLPQPHIMFNVKIEQVGHLYHLLHRERPENIAIVLPHLATDVRQAFLALLPESLAMEVIESLAVARYVEPELILKLKNELEHRIQGVVGGIEQITELVQKMDEPARRSFMEGLFQRDPDTARTIRRKILFFDDIMFLPDNELQFLLSKIKPDDVAMALTGANESMTQKVMGRFSENMQKILQEMMTYRAQPQKKDINVAREKILAVLAALIEEGRINDGFLHLEETQVARSEN